MALLEMKALLGDIPAILDVPQPAYIVTDTEVGHKPDHTTPQLPLNACAFVDRPDYRLPSHGQAGVWGCPVCR